jgi:hypothetical protein
VIFQGRVLYEIKTHKGDWALVIKREPLLFLEIILWGKKMNNFPLPSPSNKII